MNKPLSLSAIPVILPRPLSGHKSLCLISRLLRFNIPDRHSPLQMRPSLVMACLHISQLLAFLNGFSLKVCVWTPSSSSGWARKRKEEGEKEGDGDTGVSWIDGQWKHIWWSAVKYSSVSAHGDLISAFDGIWFQLSGFSSTFLFHVCWEYFSSQMWHNLSQSYKELWNSFVQGKAGWWMVKQKCQNVHRFLLHWLIDSLYILLHIDHLLVLDSLLDKAVNPKMPPWAHDDFTGKYCFLTFHVSEWWIIS